MYTYYIVAKQLLIEKNIKIGLYIKEHGLRGHQIAINPALNTLNCDVPKVFKTRN